MRVLITKLRQARFGTKITTSIVVILLLLGIGLSITMHQLVLRTLLSESKVRGASHVVNLAARAGEPVLAIDYLQLRNLVDGLIKADQDILYAFVADQKGFPVVHTFGTAFPIDLSKVNPVADGETHRVVRLAAGNQEIYDFAAPIRIGSDRIGTARVGLSLGRIYLVVRQVTLTIIVSIAIAMAIAGLVSTGLARTVTRKIRILHGAAEEIIKGNLDIRAAQRMGGNCWDIMQCNKDTCPAYGNASRRCWYLVGTLCASCAAGEYLSKIKSCRECDVYKKNAGDEVEHLAEFFDVMALTLKERLEKLRTAKLDLREQQQLVQTILDATPDLVSLKDLNSRYRSVNKAFCSFVARGEQDVLGKTVAEVFSSEQAVLAANEETHVMQTGESVSVERVFVSPHAGDRLFHIVMTAVRDAEGSVIGVLSTARDITEMRKLHERVATAQRLESVGQLAAGVAHEINTPLGIILGYSQLSAEDLPEGSELRDHLALIEKYARICKKIVADLLSFSRHTESMMQALDLNEIIAQITAIVEHTFGLDRITIVRSLTDGLPPVVGDREKLGQVMMNLLTNAHDAIGSDGRITVRTWFDRDADEVVAEVADTGPGISPGNRERIFEPFFTTKGVGKGTGLGLSVTFGIIKEHGGRIDFVSPYQQTDAENRTGSGAMFSIRLPVQRQPLMKEDMQNGTYSGA